jgi:hypothetical protein
MIKFQEGDRVRVNGQADRYVGKVGAVEHYVYPGGTYTVEQFRVRFPGGKFRSFHPDELDFVSRPATARPFPEVYNPAALRRY